MDYSPVIIFEKSLIDMDKANTLTKSNQTVKHKGKKRCRCESIKHLRITSRDSPVGLAFRKAEILALDMRLSQS